MAVVHSCCGPAGPPSDQCHRSARRAALCFTGNAILIVEVGCDEYLRPRPWRPGVRYLATSNTFADALTLVCRLAVGFTAWLARTRRRSYHKSGWVATGAASHSPVSRASDCARNRAGELHQLIGCPAWGNGGVPRSLFHVGDQQDPQQISGACDNYVASQSLGSLVRITPQNRAPVVCELGRHSWRCGCRSSMGARACRCQPTRFATM